METNTAVPQVCNAGNTFFIEVKIGKKQYPALLDTGSEVTLLPKHLADLDRLKKSARKLRTANGTEINLVGEWHTTISLGPLKSKVNFLVSDQIGEILLRVDWLKENKCLMSFEDCSIFPRLRFNLIIF